MPLKTNDKKVENSIDREKARFKWRPNFRKWSRGATSYEIEIESRKDDGATPSSSRVVHHHIVQVGEENHQMQNPTRSQVGEREVCIDGELEAPPFHLKRSETTDISSPKGKLHKILSKEIEDAKKNDDLSISSNISPALKRKSTADEKEYSVRHQKLLSCGKRCVANSKPDADIGFNANKSFQTTSDMSKNSCTLSGSKKSSAPTSPNIANKSKLVTRSPLKDKIKDIDDSSSPSRTTNKLTRHSLPKYGVQKRDQVDSKKEIDVEVPRFPTENRTSIVCSKPNPRDTSSSRTYAPPSSLARPKKQVSISTSKSFPTLPGNNFEKQPPQYSRVYRPDLLKNVSYKSSTLPIRKCYPTRRDCRSIFWAPCSHSTLKQTSAPIGRRAPGSPHGMIFNREEDYYRKLNPELQAVNSIPVYPPTVGVSCSASKPTDMRDPPSIQFFCMDRSSSPVRSAIEQYENLLKSSSSPELEANAASSNPNDLGHCEPHVDGVSGCNSKTNFNKYLETSRSPSPNPFKDPLRYKLYVLRLMRASRVSPHFQRLKSYYRSLERLMELDDLINPTDNSKIHRLMSQKSWQRIMNKQRALAEMKYICEKLDKAKQKREFFAPSQLKSSWYDLRPISQRRYSVENLKHFYEDFQQQQRDNSYPDYRFPSEICDEDKNSSLTPSQVQYLKGKLRSIYGSHSSILSSSSRGTIHNERKNEISPTNVTMCADAVSVVPKRIDSSRGKDVHDYNSASSLKKSHKNDVLKQSEDTNQDRFEQSYRPLSTSPLLSEMSPRTSYSADASNLSDPNQFVLVLDPYQSNTASRCVTPALSEHDRHEIVERSERLCLLRNSRLRRPMSILSLCSGQHHSGEKDSSESSAQTVIERRCLKKSEMKINSDSGELEQMMQEENYMCRSETPDSGALRCYSAPPCSSPQNESMLDGQFDGERPLFSSEYLPEKSMSSIDLRSMSRQQTDQFRDQNRNGSRSASPYRSVSFSTQPAPPSGYHPGQEEISECKRTSRPASRYAPPPSYYTNSGERSACSSTGNNSRNYHTKGATRKNISAKFHHHTINGSYSLPHIHRKNTKLTGLRTGDVKNLRKHFESYHEGQRRVRSWSPPKSLDQTGLRSRMREKIAFIQKRLTSPSKNETSARYNATCMSLARIKRGETNRLRQIFQSQPYRDYQTVRTLPSPSTNRYRHYRDVRIYYTNPYIRETNQKYQTKTANIRKTPKCNQGRGPTSRDYIPDVRSKPGSAVTRFGQMGDVTDQAAIPIREQSSASGCLTSAVPPRTAFSLAQEDYRSAVFKRKAQGYRVEDMCDRICETRNLVSGTPIMSVQHHRSVTNASHTLSSDGRTGNTYTHRTYTSDSTIPRVMFVRAMFNFTPVTNRELGLRRGDVVLVRRRVDQNWLEGEVRSRVGIFPINYVEVVPYMERRV